MIHTVCHSHTEIIASTQVQLYRYAIFPFQNTASVIIIVDCFIM